jgi:hypothetical protein
MRYSMKFYSILLSFTFCLGICWAQDITINTQLNYPRVSGPVSGNGNPVNNGLAPFSASPIGNSITISSSVREESLGSLYGPNIYGGYSDVPGVDVKNNIVNITHLGNVRNGYIYWGGR